MAAVDLVAGGSKRDLLLDGRYNYFRHSLSK
jgi:hypothetical protein